MRYILYNKNKKIVEMTDHGEFVVDVDAVKLANPELDFLEIDEDECREMEGRIDEFKIVNGGVKECNAAEKNSLRSEKESWRKANTVQGLQEQIDLLKQELNTLKAK